MNHEKRKGKLGIVKKEGKPVVRADDVAFKTLNKDYLVTFPFEVVGLGLYVPENIVTNKDIEKKFNIKAEDILTKTGIEKRHISDKNEGCSDMAIKCAKKAIEKAKMSPLDIELIILASVGPDYSTPPTACIIQDQIGAKNAVGFDIEVACTGFLWAIHIASQFIKCDTYESILVIASEPTRFAANYKDPNSFILLGEGAACAILKKTTENKGIIGTYFKADGSKWALATIKAGGTKHPYFYKEKDIGSYLFSMNGRQVYKYAVRSMVEAYHELIKRNNIRESDIKLVIPHQANKRILDSVKTRLNLPDNKVFNNINRFGNTSGATIPIALADAESQGLIKRNDLICLLGFGAGINWGGMIIKW